MTRRQSRTDKLSRAMLGALAVALMVSLFGYITRMADIAQNVMTIDLLKKDIRLMREDEQQLQVQLGAASDLERVSDEATLRLLMVPPDQVRLVSLEGYAQGNESTARVYADNFHQDLE